VRYTYTQNGTVYLDSTIRTNNTSGAGSFTINGPFRVGQTIVTTTASDTTGLATPANNTSSACSFIVTINDNTAPTVTCRPFTLTLGNNGQGTLAPTDVLQSGSDCGPGNLTYTVSQTNFTCANQGANTVTLTATDAAGNSSTCTATVTVMSNIVATATATGETCTGNGTITVTATGGTPGTASSTGGGGYNYNIISGPSDNTSGDVNGTYTGLESGTYIVQVNDNSTCFDTVTVVVGEAQKLTTDPRVVATAPQGLLFNAVGTSRNINLTISELGGFSANNLSVVIPFVSGYTFSMGTGSNNADYTFTTNTAGGFYEIFKNTALACGAGSSTTPASVLTVTMTRNTANAAGANPVTFLLRVGAQQSSTSPNDYTQNDRSTLIYSAENQ
jgi:hypothetical protein